jgi:hypothetical protein
MTNVNKLNVRSIYAWSTGPNGFEGVFIICPNDENIIELTDNMKRHQKLKKEKPPRREICILWNTAIIIISIPMIMNIYIIQDLDLDVKNFHNKFKFFYIIYFAYIFIIACNYTFAII